MKTTMARWLSALVLSSTALAGCGSRTEAPPAPVTPPAASPVTTLKQEPVAAPSCPAATPLIAATPLNAATPAKAEPARGAPSKAEVDRKPAKLKVKRLVLAQGVKNREPVEPSSLFDRAEAERVYAFVEVENLSDHEGEITVAFIPPGGGSPVGHVTLEVGASPRWRTWAYTRGARKAGEWTAVVRSETGEVLAREAFEVI